jgi:RimJ/RimL family protein N-acetyltransferase
MDATSPPVAAPTYRIRVEGHLDAHWSDRLGGLDITRSDDGTSTLSGPVADQAQLHGVLAALRDVGVTLLELRAAETSGEPATSVGGAVLHRRLHTERLTLRPAAVEDADPTWKFRQLAEVNEWLTGCPDDIDGYRDLFTDPARLAATVVVELGHDTGSGNSGEVIGDFMLRREDAWAQLEVADEARGAQAELGWVLDPAYAGHGYATEAVRELLRYCFEDLGVRRVVANCFLGNDSSWRLMERVGMRRESHAVRESLHRSGEWLDTVTYALLADEWTAQGRPPTSSLGG